MYIKMIIHLSLVFVFLFFLNSSVFSSDASEKGTMQEDRGASLADVKNKIDEAAQSISQYTAAQQDQAVEKAGKELEELDRNMAVLEQKVNRHWDRFSSETRQKWQDTRQQLEKKRVAAAEWFGGVKHGSAAAWDEIQKGYGRAYSELEQSWERARKEFSKDTDDDAESMKK